MRDEAKLFSTTACIAAITLFLPTTAYAADLNDTATETTPALSSDSISKTFNPTEIASTKAYWTPTRIRQLNAQQMPIPKLVGGPEIAEQSTNALPTPHADTTTRSTGRLSFTTADFNTANGDN